MTSETRASDTSPLWWSHDAWSGRALDFLTYIASTDGASKRHPETEDDFLMKSVRTATAVAGASPEYVKQALPTEEFLLRTYEHLPVPTGTSAYSGEVDGQYPVPHGMGRFQQWLFFLERNQGNLDWVLHEGDQYFTGHNFRQRANLLARSIQWTADEAEQVAYQISRACFDFGEDFGKGQTVRELVKESLEAPHDYVTQEWDWFLANPYIPLLPAPAGEKESLWDFITDHMIRLALTDDASLRGAYAGRFRSLFLNPSLPSATLKCLVDAITSQNHPHLSRGDELLLQAQSHFAHDGTVLTDTDIPTRELLEGMPEALLLESFTSFVNDLDNEDATYATHELLSRNSKEAGAREAIKAVLATENPYLMSLMLPAIPAFLNEMEREMTGDVGNVPVEWLLELI